MQAAVVEVLGQAPTYKTFPEPVPNGNEVLVHVHAAGLHSIVKALSGGSHYAGMAEVPIVPGVDGVGTVDDRNRV